MQTKKWGKIHFQLGPPQKMSFRKIVALELRIDIIPRDPCTQIVGRTRMEFRKIDTPLDFSQKKNLWQLWIWWDLINKSERYREVVRFACEEAVSGGVYIRAISQTLSYRNCSSIPNLWQICDRICDNYLTNLSVLVVHRHNIFTRKNENSQNLHFLRNSAKSLF